MQVTREEASLYKKKKSLFLPSSCDFTEPITTLSHAMQHNTIQMSAATFGSDGNLQWTVACFGQNPAVLVAIYFINSGGFAEV